MSYILDALKKADRQRHLAQVPTVATIHRTPATGSRRPWPWIVVVAVVVLVNAAVLGWLLRPTAVSPTSAPSRATQTASTVPDSLSPPAVTAPAPAEPRAGSRPSATGKATPPSGRADVVAPRSGAIDSKAAAAKPVEPKPAPPVALAPAAPSAQAPISKPGTALPAAQPAPTAKPAEGGAVPTPPTAKAVPPPTRAATPTETSPPATTAAPAPKPTDRVAAATPSTPPRAAVGTGQDVLPQMHLQMLVYSDVPSERLVFINNQKYVEGQSVEGKAVVETITPEGAMVSYQGKRVLLRAEASATR